MSNVSDRSHGALFGLAVGDAVGATVVQSLEAAIWCFAQTNNYRDAVLLAANLGDDADTTAAICGQIAGAFYGASNIPSEWMKKLSHKEQILDISERLTEK